MGEYQEMSEATSAQYVKTRTDLFNQDDVLTAKEIGDGNINWVFRIENAGKTKSVIFKQALPFVRIVGEEWPLTLDRARIEAETTRTFGSLCPENVPKVLHSDDDMALTIYEDLGHMKLMRHELMEMKQFPLFADQMGYFLAKTFLHTSHFVKSAEDKKEDVKKFINPELCRIVEDLVFTDPFYDAPGNDINPELKSTVEELWRMKDVILEASRLKEIYMTKTQALIHGDLHTGSAFITSGELKIFDAEFAFYGPPAYDMGCVLGNLLLNYFSWYGRTNYEKKAVEGFKEYLLNTIDTLYKKFTNYFKRIWKDDVRSEYVKIDGFVDELIKEHLRESIGFAGCECIRRSFGLAQVTEMIVIKDLKKRSEAQKRAVKTGAELIRIWSEITSIDELKTVIEEIERK